MAYSWQCLAVLGIRLWPCECRLFGANGNTAQSGGTDHFPKLPAGTVAGNSGAGYRPARIHHRFRTFMTNSVRYVIDLNITKNNFR